MTFFIQQGYGKGSKIADVAEGGNLGGVILSPGDEDPVKLGETVRMIRGLGLDARLDPQSYIYAPEPAGTANNHPAHGLDLNFSWHATPKQVTRAIRSVRRANEAIGVTDRWLTPTCWLASFENLWTPLSLSLAAAAADDWGGERTIVSVAVSEDAFADWRAVDVWLDAVTTLDVAGFYFAIDRKSSTYPPNPWNVDHLANILRVIYRLGELNGYEVAWGYSDVEGLIGLAAGASHAASGWHYSLRQFNRDKWVRKSGGGSAPTPRALVGRLWAPLKAADEVHYILEKPDLLSTFTRSERTLFEARPLSSFTLGEAQVQYMSTLARSARIIEELSDTGQRIATVLEKLGIADDRYEAIQDSGIVLDPRYRSRLRSLRQALEQLVASEKIPLV